MSLETLMESSTISFHTFYVTKNGMLLCEVTMTLIRQEKNGNIFFLEQHIHPMEMVLGGPDVSSGVN